MTPRNGYSNNGKEQNGAVDGVKKKPQLPGPKVEPKSRPEEKPVEKGAKVVELFPGALKREPFQQEESEENPVEEPFPKKESAQEGGSGKDIRVVGLQFGEMIDSHARMVSCGEHGEVLETYILGFGKRPKGVKGGLRVVGSDSAIKDMEVTDIYQSLQELSRTLKSQGLPYSEGPYGEKDNLLKRLVLDVFRDIKPVATLKRGDLFAIFERVMDRIRPVAHPGLEAAFPRRFGRSKLNFHLIPNLTTRSDELPTAANILADKERVVKDDVTGGTKFGLMHPMEPYLLACAVLRRLGMWAFPARAIGEGEEPNALIAVLDMKQETPLHVFTLLRQLPDMGTLKIFTDKAMMGHVHGMRSFSRIKHMAAELVIQFLDGRPLSEGEMEHQFDRIAEDLFQYYKGYGGAGDLIDDALAFLRATNFQAETWIGMRAALSGPAFGNTPILRDLFLQGVGIEKEAHILPVDPEHADLLFSLDPDEQTKFVHLYPRLQPAAISAWTTAEVHARICVDNVYKRLRAKVEALEERSKPKNPSS